jgi:hypothetical protein
VPGAGLEPARPGGVTGLRIDQQNSTDGRLPQMEWQDEQFMRVARKFRHQPNGDILGRGFAIFPRTAPACSEFKTWVTTLCTADEYSSLRA